MTYILNIVYSVPFFLGALCGGILWMLYGRSKVRWQNRYDPLPDGAQHHANHISRVWIAGLGAVFTLGYVLNITNTTHDQTIQLADNATRCWREAYQSTKAQIEINRENAQINAQQQELQRDFDRDTVDWISKLLSPPNGLAAQEPNSAARQAYGMEVSRTYFAQIDDLGAKFDDLVKQRGALDGERAKHPLPEVTCGK